MLRSILSIASFLLIFVSNFTANAQSLDPSFGVNGVANIKYPSNGPNGGVGMVLQPDKKILLLNYYVVPDQSLGTRAYLVVTRLNENGALDNSFGQAGYFAKDLGPYSSVTQEISGRRIGLQSDGKIVVTAATYNQSRLFNDVLVLRLNSNGTIDNSFGTNGTKQFNIGAYSDAPTCILLQTDGKVVIGVRNTVGNTRHYAIVRLNSNGQFDNTFKSTGISTFQVGPSNGGEEPASLAQQ